MTIVSFPLEGKVSATYSTIYFVNAICITRVDVLYSVLRYNELNYDNSCQGPPSLSDSSNSANSTPYKPLT